MTEIQALQVLINNKGFCVELLTCGRCPIILICKQAYAAISKGNDWLDSDVASYRHNKCKEALLHISKVNPERLLEDLL